MKSRKYLSGMFYFIGVLSFIAATVFICISHQEYITYGGDAYTGIQNASAHTANILKTFSYCFFIIVGITFIALGKYNSIKATEEIPTQQTITANGTKNESQPNSSTNDSDSISHDNITENQEIVNDSKDTYKDESNTNKKSKLRNMLLPKQKSGRAKRKFYNSTKNTNKKTWISIGLGAIGLAASGLAFSWYISLIGHIASIAGIFIGAKEKVDNNGMVGLVTCMIAETCACISTFINIF